MTEGVNNIYELS